MRNLNDTGCSLNIVFFLKMWCFFWTLQVLRQRWCLTCHRVHSLTPRVNRGRPESGIYPVATKRFRSHPFASITDSLTSSHITRVPSHPLSSPVQAFLTLVSCPKSLRLGPKLNLTKTFKKYFVREKIYASRTLRSCFCYYVYPKKTRLVIE